MNMNQTRLIPLLLAALLLTMPAAAQDEQATSLRPQWSVGQTARYDFWSSMEKNETAELFGQTQSQTTTYLTEGQVLWVVDAVEDDGSAACTMRMVKIKYTISSDEGEPIIIDSENPGGGDESTALFDDLMAAMVGTPLTVRIKPDGSVDTVEGLDELIAQAGQDAVDADIIPDQLDFIESASELATLVAAPESATAGQEWNTRQTWNQDNVMPGTEGTADWDTTYTLASVGQLDGVPIATVKSRSDIQIEVDLGALPDGAPDIDIQVNDAQATAEILFDLSRHETAARHDTMSYVALVTISPPNDEIPPVQVTITEKSKSQLLRVAEE